MVTLGNSPRSQTPITLEARKSFSLGMYFRNINDNPIDITDDELTLAIATVRGNDPVLSAVAVMVDPEEGYARFDFQADDLDLPIAIYNYSITLVNEGYSGIIVKGELELLQNTSDVGLGEEYTFDQPPINLAIKLHSYNRIYVTVDRTVVGSAGPAGPPGPEGPEGPAGSGASDPDVAGYVDDVSVSETRRAVLNLTGRGEPIVNHGAVGDGVTSDLAAFEAADAAALANGGGPVMVGPDHYMIDDVFQPSAGNWLAGSMNALAIPFAGNCIVLSGATARVKLSGDAQGRGGRHGRFNIDADGQGDPEGALLVTINDQVLEPITVANGPGVGALIYASQNSKIMQLAVDQCEDNVVIDGGSGGLTIENMHSTSPSRFGLHIHDSDPGGHAFGYQYGPADIFFFKPLVEQYTGSAQALIRMDSGTRIKMEQPGLSVNGQSLSGHVVEITNDDFPNVVAAEVEFSSGNYHGGPVALEKIFYIKGTNPVPYNKLVVNGQSLFQQSEALFTTDGPTLVALDDEQWYIAPTVAAIFNAANPASSHFFWRKIQRTGVVYSMPAASGAFSGHTPLAVRLNTDSTAGSRWYKASDGTDGWADGTNNVALVSSAPNLTDKVLDQNGVRHTKKFARAFSSQSITTSVALALDVSTINPKHVISVSGVSGAITSWTLTNPIEGQEIELWITRAGAQTITLPTNIKWNADTAPTAFTAGKYTVLKLTWSAGASRWFEQAGRVEGMSTS